MKILTECNLAQLVVDILNGKTVVFPTETSYGLGCDATNQTAVDKIFKIKGRPSDKPLLVVVPTVEMAKEYLVWNDLLKKIATKYWPGAVTVVAEYRRDEARPLPSPLLCGGEGSQTSPPVLPSVEGRGSYPPPSQRRGQGEVSLDGTPSKGWSWNRAAGLIRTLKFRRELRSNQTEAEKLLWQHLRNKRLGEFKFKRQHGIGPYIVDFYHADSKTVIEIDGDVHFIEDSAIEKDKKRQKWLEEHGYCVLRFNNVDVFSNLESVLEHIYYNVSKAMSDGETSPQPSPLWRRVWLAIGVVSKTNTIAIRVTSHPLLKSITEKLGRPLVATSANISDAGNLYRATDVIAQFSKTNEQPDIVLDYGDLPAVPPTTLVEVIKGELKVLRQGAVQVTI